MLLILQGIVAASLKFDEVLLHVVPMTHWWAEKRISSAMQAYLADAKPLENDINGVLLAAKTVVRQRRAANQFRISKRIKDTPLSPD